MWANIAIYSNSELRYSFDIILALDRQADRNGKTISGSGCVVKLNCYTLIISSNLIFMYFLFSAVVKLVYFSMVTVAL